MRIVGFMLAMLLTVSTAEAARVVYVGTLRNDEGVEAGLRLRGKWRNGTFVGKLRCSGSICPGKRAKIRMTPACRAELDPQPCEATVAPWGCTTELGFDREFSVLYGEPETADRIRGAFDCGDVFGQIELLR